MEFRAERYWRNCFLWFLAIFNVFSSKIVFYIYISINQCFGFKIRVNHEISSWTVLEKLMFIVLCIFSCFFAYFGVLFAGIVLLGGLRHPGPPHLGLLGQAAWGLSPVGILRMPFGTKNIPSFLANIFGVVFPGGLRPPDLPIWACWGRPRGGYHPWGYCFMILVAVSWFFKFLKKIKFWKNNKIVNFEKKICKNVGKSMPNMSGWYWGV